MLRSEERVKIELSEQDKALVDQIIADPKVKKTSWLRTNILCNLAFAKFLGLNLQNLNLNKTPFVFYKGEKKTVSIKSFPSRAAYPEIKESQNPKKHDLYVLAVLNDILDLIYLDGFVLAEDLFKEENLHHDFYIKSFYDLLPMDDLKSSGHGKK